MKEAESIQLTDRVQAALLRREEKGLLRKLRAPQSTACDFSSNDYLGFARSQEFQTFFSQHLQKIPPKSTGSSGSRLLSGHSEDISTAEQVAACFHNAEDALIFNSGYDANLSLLSCIPGLHDAIVYDELVHASMHDGMRMSRAQTPVYPFRHNDLNSMERCVRQAITEHKGSVLVCIETVYSMDGDVASVRDLLDACASIQTQLGREVLLIADEAHAAGVFGEKGEGVIAQTNSHKHPNLLATIVTFGKAFATHGAVILTRSIVKSYLINYARPFIYSTALPPHSIAAINAAYNFAVTKAARVARKRLWKNIYRFHLAAKTRLSQVVLVDQYGRSPIQGIYVAGNKRCVLVAEKLREHGFDVYPIRSPTVPQGTERIRIILHAHNTEAEMDGLINATLQALVETKTRSRL